MPFAILLHGTPDSVSALPHLRVLRSRRSPFNTAKPEDAIRAYTEIISHGYMKCNAHYSIESHLSTIGRLSFSANGTSARHGENGSRS